MINRTFKWNHYHPVLLAGSIQFLSIRRIPILSDRNAPGSHIISSFRLELIPPRGGVATRILLLHFLLSPVSSFSMGETSCLVVSYFPIASFVVLDCYIH